MDIGLILIFHLSSPFGRSSSFSVAATEEITLLFESSSAMVSSSAYPDRDLEPRTRTFTLYPVPALRATERAFAPEPILQNPRSVSPVATEADVSLPVNP